MIAGLLLVGIAHASAVSEGSAAFDKGDVASALATWQDAAKTGHPSADLAYDLGVGYYQTGDKARAIAWWRAARLLAPRDGDAVHDLALARGELKGMPEPAPSPVLWTEFATVGEVGGLAVLLLAAASAGVWLRPKDSPWIWAVPGAVGAVLGVLSLQASSELGAHPVAVIVDHDAAVRDVADTKAKTTFTLPVGSEVGVERELDGFLLIDTGDGKRGWVPAAGALLVSPSVDPVG